MVRSTQGRVSRLALFSISLAIPLFLLNACASLPNIGDIVPQIARPTLDNHALPSSKSIELANALLAAGKRREAAAAYFEAAQGFSSPQRERLILQASELAAIIKDAGLAQRYLAPLRFPTLNAENQARFRFTQAQLALNDGNFRETLRILPQRVNGLPIGLAQKILNARMRAAQSSRDKIALVQELVLQEPTLRSQQEVKLNHDRIWSHIQKIPQLKLDQSRKHINHPALRNWLDLGYYARLSRKGGSVAENARGSILGWKQRHPNHPGISKVDAILRSAPVAKVTPYRVGKKKSPSTTIQTPPPSNYSGTQVAVILPLTGRFADVGNTILQGIQDAQKKDSGDSRLKIYDSEKGSIQGIYQTALNEGASLVVGPFNKNKIYTLAKTNLPKPVLGLNYIQDSGTSNPGLKQFGLLPEDEAVQLAQSVTAQGKSRVAILTPNSTWGKRLRDAMRRAVIERGGKVVIMKSYLESARTYFPEAQNLAFRSKELDAILMIATPTRARILYPALREEIKNLPVYATSHVFNGIVNAEADRNLDGLMFTETPIILDMIQKGQAPKTSLPRLYAMGADAYLVARNISRLQNGALNGKTGRIRLSQDGTLHRTLRWAQFRNGVPTLK